jgi:hypothetical protein
MILKDLEPGDKFVHAKSKDKAPKQFIVKGNCLFNSGHGSSTRLCIELKTGAIMGKSCRLEVIKIGESIHKQIFLEKAQKNKP